MVKLLPEAGLRSVGLALELDALSEELVVLASSDVFSLRHPDHAWSREIARVAEQVTAS